MSFEELPEPLLLILGALLSALVPHLSKQKQKPETAQAKSQAISS
jgi:hypothetical protein